MGVWLSCGRNAHDAYIANPTSSATSLVVHTAVSRNICVSIKGETERFSTQIHMASRITAPARSPRTVEEVHPHCEHWLRASRRQTSHEDSKMAGKMLILPGVRTGDSGTNSMAARAAAAVMIIGNQNSQC
jgi:hypothetical protein